MLSPSTVYSGSVHRDSILLPIHGIDLQAHSVSTQNNNTVVFTAIRTPSVTVGKPEGVRPLGRPRRRWEDGIRMDLMEIGFGGVWIGFDCLRTRAVVSAVMNLRVLAPRS
jgi:hypothetical protein